MHGIYLYFFAPLKFLIQKGVKDSCFTWAFPRCGDCPAWEQASAPSARYGRRLQSLSRGGLLWLLPSRVGAPNLQAPPASGFSLQIRCRRGQLLGVLRPCLHGMPEALPSAGHMEALTSPIGMGIWMARPALGDTERGTNQNSFHLRPEFKENWWHNPQG